MAEEKIDIAIVGGGVSGVYCAWKLKTKYPKKKIVLFEGSDHIGGRLLSVRPPDIKNMVAELGGMRILPKVQPLITKLIADLNKLLPKKEKIEIYNFPVDEPQNIAYLRGVYLRLNDFTQNPDKVPYRLSFLEHGESSGSIIINAIEQIVPGITNPNLTEDERREMVQHASFAGKPLYMQGFWNVLMRVITGEAYSFGIDAGGYNTTLSNWNCADAIPWFLSDFGINPDYKGFKNGFQQVPLSMAQLFTDNGGEIRLLTKVTGFTQGKNGLTLTLEKSGKAGKNANTVEAKALILAMPRRSLDLITPNSALLQQISPLIGAVTPRPLFKLFTTYAYPWWRAAGYTDANNQFKPVQSGRTLTDLPVRQTYYWPTQEGKPAEAGPAMLLASYDDGVNIGFWDGFRPRRRQAWQQGLEVSQPEEPFEGRDKDSSSWSRYRASQGMVAEVARQLAEVHDLKYTPEVHNAAFRDWGDDPFGGGWNSWNIGVKSWEVRDQITKPVADANFYICGEAYSDAQGWVEGALQTADIVLGKFQCD